MHPTERNIVDVRKFADGHIDRIFDDRYAVENGFARIPTEEREAVRFIVRRRLSEAPTATYRVLGPFKRMDVAEEMVKDTIQNYERYAQEYLQDAAAQDIDLPPRLPILHQTGFYNPQARPLIERYEAQLRRLREHLDQKSDEVGKQNDTDSLTRLHDQYTEHLRKVEDVLACLERHDQHAHHAPTEYEVQQEEHISELDNALLHVRNWIFNKGKTPEYPPFGSRYIDAPAAWHALHEVQAMGPSIGIASSDPHIRRALFTYRKHTLRQYCLSLDGFLRNVKFRLDDLRHNKARRARQTQRLVEPPRGKRS